MHGHEQPVTSIDREIADTAMHAYAKGVETMRSICEDLMRLSMGGGLAGSDLKVLLDQMLHAYESLAQVGTYAFDHVEVVGAESCLQHGHTYSDGSPVTVFIRLYDTTASTWGRWCEHNHEIPWIPDFPYYDGPGRGSLQPGCRVVVNDPPAIRDPGGVGPAGWDLSSTTAED